MSSLIKLLAWGLIESGMAGSARAAIIRMTAGVFCAGLAFGCAATAFWILALLSLGPAGAPLAVAAAFSIAATIVAALAWLILRHHPRPRAAAMAPQLLPSEATRLFTEHKGIVLLAALIAGMAAATGGRKP